MFTTVLMLAAATTPSAPPPEVQTPPESRSSHDRLPTPKRPAPTRHGPVIGGVPREAFQLLGRPNAMRTPSGIMYSKKGDEFIYRLADRSGTVEVFGKRMGALPPAAAITVWENGKGPVTYTADEVPEKWKATVQRLLAQVR